MPGYHTSKDSPDELNRIGCFLGAMEQANADVDADNVPPKADIETAFAIGRNVAQIATRFIV